jgi:uncharacterized Ntn-hydrolase superfamily protein
LYERDRFDLISLRLRQLSRGRCIPALAAAMAMLWMLCGCVTSSVPYRVEAPAVEMPRKSRGVATFSIVAFDPEREEWGVAVQSKFFGVGTVVPWAQAGVGAIATQSYANIRYGPDGLELLAEGRSAEETLAALLKKDDGRERRQVGIVDARGRPAAFTGEECNEWAGQIVGTNFCAQGNLLAGEEVVERMASEFRLARDASEEQGTGLADWLMAALRAGQEAGGDKRGQQSAALLVVRERGGYAGAHDRFIDLRVEDHEQPIEELTRLLEIHKKFYEAAHRRPALEPVE